MALDDADTMSTSTALRLVMAQLAATYEHACSEYGEDSKQAAMLSDALLFMRGWLRRYSQAILN